VNWFDAILFCNWLSHKESRKPAYLKTDNGEWRCNWTADGYRLPSEAEWEYACRAGSAGAYCFGADEKELAKYGWFAGNSHARTWPVGSKLPNAWGLFDMHGNVFEWCWDWRDYYAADPVTDPVGPDKGIARVLRGGVFVGGASLCRSSHRGAYNPLHREPDYGFRVCLTVQ
jgi:formylglycine-generating enzyme required for sulfatase activity